MNKSLKPIPRDSAIHRLLLRAIVIFYMLLFLSGLVSSGYFFSEVIKLVPIPMLGFLKYILLSILFLVLLVTALRALTLKPMHLSRLTSATGNFKWLFTLAVMICIAAKAGLFDLSRNHPVEISYIQIVVLTVIAVFCYWSDQMLKGEETFIEENEGEQFHENP
ncbi:magnesium-transporting ATPase (P-type) [Pedobacter cryoconitis]|uniref:Magnesium-transporting ATPase (P-type) n=1 Tax=Pedobacter cryoconitis TaxID=188932 RepID=A0A7W8ZLH5_9SPHI|nr:hypothetical protein [Pedobacter cryoconitis]MBB5636222.1 magnesium-transporting ATPase (P-type) [Pedobacter cryoconitis]MBB6272860.1 magnesium-transporting ATPase (P-type) [Pedobacter cryoconitis]